MFSSCSPIYLFFVVVAIFMLPVGINYWGFTRSRREGSSDFDRDAWLLISLFIAAMASTGLCIIYIFFHTVGC